MRVLFPMPGAAIAAALLGAIADVSAQVVVSEIHYHPVEEPAFDNATNYTPVLDLSEDVHEFVEIQNTGASAVDLSGWTLSGGIDFTFPAGSSIPAGGFKVIAKNVSRLQAVYSISGVLGPYSGKLSNSGDTVRLRNAADATVDSVTYSSSFPWAESADALGANDRFTGLNSASYQYKGRSLQRVSVTAASNDPANWLASPLSPGPTPGAAQAVSRAVPQPVVVARSRFQATDGSALILAGNAVTVTCGFSSAESLGGVQLEWFVDGIDSTGETRTVTAMTGGGSGPFTASIPAQTARAIVRYRFLADRGNGTEIVSPRADDPSISQVGAGNARQSWHGYFVQPAGRSTAAPNYDLFISSANLAQIRTNAQQGLAGNTSRRRVTAANQNGLPREVPWVAATAPQWNGTVPAVFACDGVLHDVHIRFHGSRYHRYQNAANLTSFKLHFPGTHPFRDRTSWFITEHGNEFAEAVKMNRLLDLPAAPVRTVSWHFNSNAVESKLEQGEHDKEMLDAYHELQRQLDPGSVREANGELYKVVGNRDPSQNNNEGPYTKGDLAPMLANNSWTQLQRCDWTFSLQNHGWKGPAPMRDMIAGMWAARGDSPAATTLANNAANLANTRAWFLANFDIDTTLTSLAMLQWMGVWDDAAHNQFFWRRANGKWVRLGWDYDFVMTTTAGGGGVPGASRVTQTIYAGEAGFNVFDGTNWWKDSFLKCFRTEFKQRLWELNNSFLDPVNLSANGFTTAVAFAHQRQANVNAQLALGTYHKPARPMNASPAGGGIVTGGASLTTSAYSSPNARAHASTRWEIRTASGDYESPVVHVTSATSLTSLPVPFGSLVYGQTYWWRATHIDADGHPSVVSSETSFTWGTASVTPGALVLNEILAVNKSAAPNGHSHPDYIEIRNNSAGAYDLTGVTLTDDPASPAKFTFPAGNILPAGGHLILWCDDETSSGFHTGFGLSSGGETVLLMNGGTILDSVTFGPQAPDLAIGRIVNGTGAWTACEPTPGLSNNPKTLGSTATLSINEWMAGPAYGEDWFELYNSGASPVALGGLWLSDTPGTPKITRIPELSYIAGGGFTRFEADGTTGGGDRCNFKLSAGGESIVLTAGNGVTQLDRVNFGSQAADTSQGYLPDGGNTVVSFPLTASPERPNWLPTTIIVNEVLSRPVAGGEDFIELHNPTAGSVDIGNWWLSDDFRSPKKFRIPAGTSIPAGGYLVFTASQFATGAAPFSLGSTGDEACLSAVDGGGALTGHRAQVSFEASAQGMSFGRVAASGLANGGGGAEFWPLASVTPGTVNAGPWTRPVIVNEVMYHPVDGEGGEDITATEFVELHNPTNATVDLAGWRLKGDSDFTFAAGTMLPPSGYLLVVGFDPSDSAALAGFRSTYGLTASTAIAGPFDAKLTNNSHRIEIAWPDDFDGVAGHVNSDWVEYRDSAPWSVEPDGTGTSLQRLSRSAIGNDAANWASATPTPGAVNAGLFTTLAVWTETLPDGVKGTPYSFQLTAVGGTTPYVWSLSSGSLPAGLMLSSGGLLEGLPTTPGTANFTLQLTGGGTVTRAFSLIVRPGFADTDNDNMPDDWEATHSLVIGIDDSAADADGDGQSNLDEYLAGTDPQDGASVFAITGLTAPAGGTVSVTWSGVAGKRYRIGASTDLVTWTPQASFIECHATGPMSRDVTVGPEPAVFLRVAVEP